jgi:hypothetical protein
MYLNGAKGKQMDTKSFFNDIQGKVNQMLENSPAKDIEKNIRALVTQTFSKLDLITREEFDAQTLTLVRIRERLDALERKVEALESTAEPIDTTLPPL